ncbi:MAG: PEP/pyruvate-binding domain-containing protein [Pseudomonadota bacterium]
MSLLSLLFRRKKSKGLQEDESFKSSLQDKYRHFRGLLESNAELLKLISDAEEKLSGQYVFGYNYIRSLVMRSIFHVGHMVYSLDSIGEGRYSKLKQVFEEISAQLRDKLEDRRGVKAETLVLPYDQITKDMGETVGGKNANLGEVHSIVQLPVPRGFAITTLAFDSFIAENNLMPQLRRHEMELITDDPQGIIEISSQIERLILDANVPEPLAEAFNKAYDILTAADNSVKVAMRSSAVGEDDLLSFAGQYLSVLNVPRHRFLNDYKRIIASLFSPRAITYRLHKGIQMEDMAMGVACLEMISGVSSGVMYTRHPFDFHNDNIIINALWGLCPYVVDGVIEPDRFTLSKAPIVRLLKADIARKSVQLSIGDDYGLLEKPVPEALQDQPCLNEEQVFQLAEYGIRLEKHFGCAQDVEWTLAPDGRIIILQTRPLRLASYRPESAAEAFKKTSGYPILLEGGDIACPGVGSGPVHLVQNDHDLLSFPDGGVLVAAHSSPKFIVIMRKAQAIVTDAGSITGHMASLAREEGVPTILNTKKACALLKQGTEVTVDAYSGRIYGARVPELLSLRSSREGIMKETHIYKALRRVADLIIPLNLTDPKGANFNPKGCRTLHDATRYVHERCYAEMFQTGDLVSRQDQGVTRLIAPIPLDLYLIDLGGGLFDKDSAAATVTAEQVRSISFQALLKGMLREDIRSQQPRPVNWQGFFSVMSRHMFSPPNLSSERFGDRSYAVISENYLNFSSRIGYHYSVLDAYCGPVGDMNYINFEFKGGGADDVRRNRRARLIQKVLRELSFLVEVKADQVSARFAKQAIEQTTERLDYLGRLLQFTRQMDMLMHTESSITDLADCFLKGDYNLQTITPLHNPQDNLGH